MKALAQEKAPPPTGLFRLRDRRPAPGAAVVSPENLCYFERAVELLCSLLIEVDVMNAPNIAIQPIFPLEAGDHLTREEFERRYHAMPRLKKAELIEGIVYMPSPANSDGSHGEQHYALIGWLFNYQVQTPGVEEQTIRRCAWTTKTKLQPDVTLLVPARTRRPIRD